MPTSHATECLYALLRKWDDPATSSVEKVNLKATLAMAANKLVFSSMPDNDPKKLMAQQAEAAMRARAIATDNWDEMRACDEHAALLMQASPVGVVAVYASVTGDPSLRAYAREFLNASRMGSGGAERL